ncbi:MAG: efflux RND transporter periplasmic adaptor subunit [Bacteroidetes bacterium]|nr:efflux RND transporter periplasmic adaptor subunit [Bacteroidota bacterium]
MANKKSIRIWVGVAALVILIGLVVAKRAGWLGESNLVKVSAEKVMRRDLVETVSANGKVQPEVEIKISADVSGEITELYVKEGDVVKKGTLLCRINPEVYASNYDRATAAVNSSKANFQNSKSRLTQAQAQFEQSELNYNRNKKLFDEKVISPSEFENIKSSYEVSKAEVDAARQSVAAAGFNVSSAEAGLKESKENLNRTSIYAPVDGTVSKLSKEKGERVVGTNMMEGTEILRLANLNEMEVSVDVSETDIVRVSSGDTADIEVDAWLGRTFSGVVTEVANSSNLSGLNVTDQVTNYTVKVRILRDSYMDLLEGKQLDYSPFRPGMSATVEIRTRRTANVLTIPIQSVTTRDTLKKSDSSKKDSKEKTEVKTETVVSAKETQEFVFVIVDEKVSLRAVKTGIQDSQHIEILSGLKEGEMVVSGPYNAVSKTLKDKATVNVVPKEELFDKEEK